MIKTLFQHLEKNRVHEVDLNRVCVEIFSQNNNFMTRGKILKRPMETSLVISNDLKVKKAANQSVKLTIMVPKQEPFFVSGHVMYWQEELCRIENLRLIQQGERRGFFRVKTAGYGYIDLEEEECPIHLIDISLAGACILSTRELTIDAYFPLTLVLEEYTLKVRSCVVRKIDVDTYGVRFCDLNEEQISDLYAIILQIQHRIIQKQKVAPTTGTGNEKR